MAYDAFYWRDELHRYKEDYEKFVAAGKKIVKRFRDERKDSENLDARFNILWSNIKTLKPAVYSRAPKIEVSRRNKDQNDAARVASEILERVIDFELSQYQDYHNSLSNAVDDRLLVGRGIGWIRYEPTIEQARPETITDDSTNEVTGEYGPPEQITNERTPVDYVYWEDFAHLPARTWEEVTWVARRVYMSREEGEARFGEKFAEVPLTHSPDKDSSNKSTTESLKKAVVWEIWCKSTKKVHWIAENHDEMLDERDDPLELEQFFPCPKPIYSTVTTDSLIPVADFRLYQDQANEIDEITGRIQHLTKALKVQGIYAADEPAIERLMKEGNDAVLIPITNWPAFTEKGGLGNAVQFLPLGEIVQSLNQLYAARESCKQIIYETTGISDILRGASMAQETATAQQIKSQFASIRLNDMKDDVARFARDLLRMKAEIICQKYQPEMIYKISGIEVTPDAQFAVQAIQLLKNEPMRNWAIDIQTDTLVQLDEQSDKQSRIEFLTASSQFLTQAVTAGTQVPAIAPLAMQMLLFGVRGFKIGRELEGVFEQTLQAMKAQAEQSGGQQQPDPETMKLQAEMQLEQQKAQAEAQFMQQKMQMDSQMAQQKAQSDLQMEQYKADLKAQTDIQVANIKAQVELQVAQIKSQIDRETQAAKIHMDAMIAAQEVNNAAIPDQM